MSENPGAQLTRWHSYDAPLNNRNEQLTQNDSNELHNRVVNHHGSAIYKPGVPAVVLVKSTDDTELANSLNVTPLNTDPTDLGEGGYYDVVELKILKRTPDDRTTRYVVNISGCQEHGELMKKLVVFARELWDLEEAVPVAPPPSGATTPNN